MDLRMDLTEAERKAREYVKKKYGKKVKIFFKSTSKEHGGWLIEGEVYIRKAIIFTNKRHSDLDYIQRLEKTHIIKRPDD